MHLVTFQNYPIFAQKIQKNGHFVVIEKVNIFIVGIQFLAHRLATKKLGTLKAP